MNEHKLLYWEHKTLKVYKHKAFKARGNLSSLCFDENNQLRFCQKLKQPLDGQVAAFIL